MRLSNRGSSIDYEAGVKFSLKQLLASATPIAVGILFPNEKLMFGWLLLCYTGRSLRANSQKGVDHEHAQS